MVVGAGQCPAAVYASRSQPTALLYRVLYGWAVLFGFYRRSDNQECTALMRR